MLYNGFPFLLTRTSLIFPFKRRVSVDNSESFSSFGSAKMVVIEQRSLRKSTFAQRFFFDSLRSLKAKSATSIRKTSTKALAFCSKVFRVSLDLPRQSSEIELYAIQWTGCLVGNLGFMQIETSMPRLQKAFLFSPQFAMWRQRSFFLVPCSLFLGRYGRFHFFVRQR